MQSVKPYLFCIKFLPSHIIYATFFIFECLDITAVLFENLIFTLKFCGILFLFIYTVCASTCVCSFYLFQNSAKGRLYITFGNYELMTIKTCLVISIGELLILKKTLIETTPPLKAVDTIGNYSK